MPITSLLVRRGLRAATVLCRSTLASLCLLSIAGCRGDRSPGEAAPHDETHHGHVIPAHKPRSFPDAVCRLRTLNDQLRDDLAGEKPGAVKTADPIHVALDIATWLPEIAADSDMPEAPWDEVNARSAALVGEYRSLLSGTVVDRLAVVEGANVAIGNLEQLLVKAGPNWFGGTGSERQALNPGDVSRR